LSSVVHCSIAETNFKKWRWFGAPQSIKTIVFELSNGKSKAYMGLQKAREFQRVVTSLLVSAKSRGAAATATAEAVVVHSSSPNHLTVHNVVDDEDVVVQSAATSSSKQDIFEIV
jgi:hypothetical protein